MLSAAEARLRLGWPLTRHHGGEFDPSGAPAVCRRRGRRTSRRIGRNSLHASAIPRVARRHVCRYPARDLRCGDAGSVQSDDGVALCTGCQEPVVNA
jgi:hypothetical protein